MTTSEPRAIRPNFLVIGASKCGTTSLCALLGQHPDVFMSDPKEPMFFSLDEVWNRGWSWFEALFSQAGGKIAVGEGSTSYSQHKLWPKTAGRIAAALPDAKLIYIVRHPMDRMESLWIQLLENRHPISFDFFDALRRYPDSFLASSNYLRELQVYRRHFPDEQIHVLFFEEFRADPRQALSDCFEFLAVDSAFMARGVDERRNARSVKTVEAPLIKAIRRLPGFGREGLLKRAVPVAVKHLLIHGVRVKAPPRPLWADADRRWVIDQIGDDTEEFLARHGKPRDYWDLLNWGIGETT